YGKAIENALKDAKLTTADVDLLIPHGLGVPKFDRAEVAGLQKAFGEDLKRIAFAPIKAQIGNTSAGCGVDAAAAVLSLANQTIPAAMNTTSPIAALNVGTAPRETKADVAVTSVYSLGGQ